MDKCTELRKYAFPDSCLLDFLFFFWWVLPPLCITGVALFDDEVPSEMKTSMVEILKRKGHHGPSKRDEVKNGSISFLQHSDFITLNACELFVALNSSQNVLENHPNTLHANEYVKAKRRVQSLNAVNDAADRGISVL